MSRTKRAASGSMDQDAKLSPVRKRGKNKKPQIIPPEDENNDKNIYELLSDNSEDENIGNNEMEVEAEPKKSKSETRKQPEQNNLKKPKIITIDNVSIELIKSFMKNIQLKEKCYLSKRRDNQVQVQCQCNDDKQAILLKLKEQKMSYFTYSENEDKTQIFVLKRHYFVSVDYLLTTLKNENIPASRVCFLRNDENNPVYLVHFEKDVINFFTLSTQHNIIDNLVIKWEKFNKALKRPTQCHRCQQYGHSSINCGKQYKCVKCIESHEPGNCSRKSREGSPQCCNCKQFHAANSKKCEYFLNYKQKIINFKKTPQPKVFKSTPAPWASPSQLNLNQTNFPTIPQKNIHTISQKDKNSHSNSESFQKINQNDKNITINSENYQKGKENIYSQFFNGQKEFTNIPGIEETMDLFCKMVNELKTSPPDQGSRFAIMMRYAFLSNV